MPASPAMAERKALKVLGYYQEAEASLIALLARRAAQHSTSPRWAEIKLAQVRELEAETRDVLKRLDAQAREGIKDAVTAAYEQGGLAALDDLHRSLEKTNKARLGGDAEQLYGLRSLDALVAEAVSNVTATHQGILRSVVNNYQTVIGAGIQADLQAELRNVTAEGAGQILVGSQSRIQAMQSALNAFATKGITGFVDKSGRGWGMESYTEMAMRTATGRAAVQGHLDRLSDEGVELVIVSDAPRECPLCRPWEGRVLAIGSQQVEIPPDTDPAFLHDEPELHDAPPFESREMYDAEHQFFADNPAGYVLEHAAEMPEWRVFGARDWLAGNTRTPTGAYRENLMLDGNELLKLPGGVSERTPGWYDSPDVIGRRAAIKDIFDRAPEGQWPEELGPVSVRVDANGRAYIYEGNKRLLEAADRGIPIPVDWKYLGGSETLEDVVHPTQFLSQLHQQVYLAEDLNWSNVDLLEAVDAWQMSYGGAPELKAMREASEQILTTGVVPDTEGGRRAIELLEAMDMSPRTDFIMYRGLHDVDPDAMERLGEIGSIHDLPLSSTSEIESVADVYGRYGRPENQVQLRFAPGSKGLVLPAVDMEAKKALGYSIQNEVLTAGRFRVVAMHYDDTGRMIVDLEQVDLPQAPPGRVFKSLNEEEIFWENLFDAGLQGDSIDIAEQAKIEVNAALAERLRGNAAFNKLAQWDFEHRGDFETLEEARAGLVRTFVDQWAATSADSDALSVALQHAAMKEFGLDEAVIGHFKVNDLQAIRTAVSIGDDEDLSGMRAFLRAQYDETQSYLEMNGIDHVTLHRGILAPEMSDEGDELVSLQPMSSFSTDHGTATDFAYIDKLQEDDDAWDEISEVDYEYAGRVLTVRVPREDIISTCRTGVGCLQESEMVVLGRDMRVQITLADSDISDVENAWKLANSPVTTDMLREAAEEHRTFLRQSDEWNRYAKLQREVDYKSITGKNVDPELNRFMEYLRTRPYDMPMSEEQVEELDKRIKAAIEAADLEDFAIGEQLEIEEHVYQMFRWEIEYPPAIIRHFKVESLMKDLADDFMEFLQFWSHELGPDKVYGPKVPAGYWERRFLAYYITKEGL